MRAGRSPVTVAGTAPVFHRLPVHRSARTLLHLWLFAWRLIAVRLGAPAPAARVQGASASAVSMALRLAAHRGAHGGPCPMRRSMALGLTPHRGAAAPGKCVGGAEPPGGSPGRHGEPVIMRPPLRRLGVLVAALAAVAAAVPGQASSPGVTSLTLAVPDANWTGSAPLPNVLGCQPDDPTCDHHVVAVADGVDGNVWSVAVTVDRPAHVAVYRLDANNQSVEVLPIQQTVVIEDGADLTAMTSSASGGPVVFAANPGQYDVEVSGAGAYTARARLCAGADCPAT